MVAAVLWLASWARAVGLESAVRVVSEQRGGVGGWTNACCWRRRCEKWCENVAAERRRWRQERLGEGVTETGLLALGGLPAPPSLPPPARASAAFAGACLPPATARVRQPTKAGNTPSTGCVLSSFCVLCRA